MAGWSEGQSEAFLIANHNRYGSPPWTAIEIHGLAMTPMAEEMKQFAFDPKEPIDDFAVRSLKHQRSILIPRAADSEPVSTVGAFGQVTTVTPTEVTSRLLLRWPDKVGDKINPFVDATMELAAA